MGKKKPAAILSKSSAKAAKKAKAAQKVERKEKKKVSKSKDDADENEDLEGILDKVSFYVPWLIRTRSDLKWASVDAERVGGCAYRHRGARGRTPKQASQRDFNGLSKWESPLVHWRGIFQ